MKLKGGLAYIDMKGIVLDNAISSDNAVYADGLYKSVYAAVKSGKIIVLYNCGGLMQNVLVCVTGYNIISDNRIVIIFTGIQNTGAYNSKRIHVKPDSTYFITN